MALSSCCYNVQNVLLGFEPGSAPGGLFEFCSAPSGGVEEIERDACFILGLLAVKVDHQHAISDAGALPGLVAIIKRAQHAAKLTGAAAGATRRAADAITNLAHENVAIKSAVRAEGGIPPLVHLLRCKESKVQRAAAGALRTLAFKNDENKNLIVEQESLPILIQMLRSEDMGIHSEVRMFSAFHYWRRLMLVSRDRWTRWMS